MTKPTKLSFDKIVLGHTFEVDGKGTMPKGEHFWCSFCGGRGLHFIVIKRNDGMCFKVGATCLDKVGLTLPASVKSVKVKPKQKKEEKKPIKVEPMPEKKEPKKVKPTIKKVTDDDLDDLFSEIE